MTGLGTKTTDHLETLSRGLALMRCFDSGRGQLAIQEAADHLSISRGAARRFLITLVNDGYLNTLGRNFRISPKVINWATAIRRKCAHRRRRRSQRRPSAHEALRRP